MSKAPRQSTGKAPINPATQGTEGSQGKKKRKKNSSITTGLQFKSAIKRIAKEINPEHHVFLTSQAISIFCAIAYDIVETAGEVAGEFASKVNKQTIGADEIMAAFEITLKGELKKLALREIHSTLSKTQGKAPSK
ncbi:Histone H2B [Nosema bombycis CQ1]|jgi:histone H2B|uniref:Histone H2B n=3 Tax=Nosema TaxID=27977 RepID=R0MEJ8_NOSB1|nr:histone H2B [Nosema bombycis]AGH33887.1 histone H2B [Nosema pernyi]EOB12532.1 Histone H2B [Nosema bombycis CQ1]EOB12545.1 Histone H2B [Nosema bombycis CQ1]|eukprot:EOB12532.1 Histone H2B [Nosema bombycis CQ1]